MAAKKASPILRVWLSSIATAVANASGERVRGEAIVGAARILAAIPDEAFTEVSKSAVMDYGDLATLTPDALVQRVTRWWEQNRPPRPGELPREVEQSGLDDDGKRWAAFFLRRMDEIAHDGHRGVVLLLVRRQSPAAFDWLLRNNTDARRLARIAGWRTEGDLYERLRDEWSDPRTVKAAIGSCRGFHENGHRTHPTQEQFRRSVAMLRGLLQRWAPQNLPMLDEAEAPAAIDPVEAAASIFGPPERVPLSDKAATDAARKSAIGIPVRRTPGTLTPDQLAAAYAASKTPATQFRAAQLATQESHDP